MYKICKNVMAAVALTVSAGCMTPSQPSSGGTAPRIQVQTGSEFTLAVGQEARLTGTSVYIQFVAVHDDSRCPIDAVCVWAGNAAVLLRLTASGASKDEVINTTLDPRVIRYENYTISLIRLEPAPKSGSAISAAEYKVTLSASQG